MQDPATLVGGMNTGCDTHDSSLENKSIRNCNGILLSGSVDNGVAKSRISIATPYKPVEVVSSTFQNNSQVSY